MKPQKTIPKSKSLPHNTNPSQNARVIQSERKKKNNFMGATEVRILTENSITIHRSNAHIFLELAQVLFFTSRFVNRSSQPVEAAHIKARNKYYQLHKNEL